MELRLQYPPTPEFAAKHAELAVAAALNVEQITLDYSPKSLADVDGIVGRFHQEGLRANQIGETVFSFGCYVGEVLVRNHKGVWKLAAATKWPKTLKESLDMIVVELPNGSVWNPIGKAFKLLENGEGDSVEYFYHVAVKKG